MPFYFMKFFNVKEWKLKQYKGTEQYHKLFTIVVNIVEGWFQ